MQSLAKLEPASPTISETYRQLNRELHERNPVYGISGKKYAKEVRQLAASLDAGTILDYGCGKETLREALEPDWKVNGYDPCIPGLDAPPLPADLVVCTDVLEHVEPAHIYMVMQDIARLTQKAAFLVVDTVPAQKTLADGRNAHLLLKDSQWWLTLFMKYFNVNSFEDHGKKVVAVVTPHA